MAYLYERLTGIEGCRGFEFLRLLIVCFFFTRQNSLKALYNTD